MSESSRAPRRPPGPGRALVGGLLGGFLPVALLLGVLPLCFDTGGARGHTPGVGPALAFVYLGVPLYGLCFLVGLWRRRWACAGALLSWGAAFACGALAAAAAAAPFFEDGRRELERWADPERAVAALMLLAAHALLALALGLALRLVPLGRPAAARVASEAKNPGTALAARRRSVWRAPTAGAAGVGLALLAVGTLGLVLELWRRAVRTPLDGPAALALAGGVLLAVFVPGFLRCRGRLAGRRSAAVLGGTYWLLLALAGLAWYAAERGRLPEPSGLVALMVGVAVLGGGCALAWRPGALESADPH